LPNPNGRAIMRTKTTEGGITLQIIMKGYGEVKLAGSGEVVSGEITLHAEGWIAVAPIPPVEGGMVRWFPNHTVQEVVWRKSLALRPPKRAAQ